MGGSLRTPLVHTWSLVACAACLLGARHLGEQGRLQLAPGALSGWALPVLVVSALLGAIGAVTVARSRDARPWVAPVLVALSVPLSTSGLLASFALDAPGFDRIVPFAGLALGGALTGASLALGWGAVGRALVSLGLVRFVIHPLRLLLLGAGLGLLGLGLDRVGLARAGIVLGLLVAFAAATHPGVQGALDGTRVPWARRSLVITAIGSLPAVLGALLVERVVPFDVVRRHEGAVLLARRQGGHEHVVVGGAGGIALFIDGHLAAASLDEERSHAALVRPALAAAPVPRRVLLLGGGTGLPERAILDDPRVERLVTVVAARDTVHLAQSLGWLRERSRAALDSPRVTLVHGDPLAWLAGSPERFNAVIANFPPPVDHGAGKLYTRYVLGLLAARLEPGGVLAVPAASAAHAPAAHASVLATLESLGLRVAPYHAAVPAQGSMSFALAARHPLAAPLLDLARDEGKDLARRGPGAVATLDRQAVVHAMFDR